MESASGPCQAYLKALSDDTRWQMVEVLISAPEPMTLGQLAETIGISNYNASRHSSVLEEVGILKTCKVGRNKLLSVAEDLRDSIQNGQSRTGILNLGCCSFEFPDTSTERK
ncbi:MAG: helix-turn-helix domain-containing protein [Verrucomicrobiales bacterium]|nr:helix-turn-helix domain-containing protein [Verrucomicrobiales bacterium]